MPNKPQHLHNGHRERMRERVQNAGMQSLADHELLEMLLYYIQPRRDTNETAHELIEECGSLSGVLEASTERLCRVPYVKDNAALYLHLLGELARRYAVSKFQTQSNPMQTVFDTPEKLVSALLPRFLGAKEEKMFALFFDAGLHMIDLVCIAEGSINSVAVTPRVITERAYHRGATSVILAHNHPGGIAMPSPEDKRLTRDLETALELMGITLIEHFVFTEQNYYPIIANRGTFEEQSAPLSAAAQYRSLFWTGKTP